MEEIHLAEVVPAKATVIQAGDRVTFTVGRNSVEGRVTNTDGDMVTIEGPNGRMIRRKLASVRKKVA
jgi:hypothetical protein